MVKEEDVIVIGDDGLDEIERNILIETFGKEEADRLLGKVGTETTPIEDAELQEVIEGAGALDEM